MVPGALLLLGSGTWLIVTTYGGWAFLGMPWLAGMVGLFAFEVVEGNTVTRLHFVRLRRLSREALAQGTVTPALAAARREAVPTFTHFLDIPILFVIVGLGAARPTTWTLFTVTTVLAGRPAGGLNTSGAWPIIRLIPVRSVGPLKLAGSSRGRNRHQPRGEVTPGRAR